MNKEKFQFCEEVNDDGKLCNKCESEHSLYRENEFELCKKERINHCKVHVV